MNRLGEVLALLEIDEEDAIISILKSVSPPAPPATRQNWTRLSTFGHSAPTTKEIWKKFSDSDFRCQRCGSQMRLTLNHINSNPKDHRLENLEVICYSCNRAISKKATVDVNQHYKLAIASIELWKEKGRFPTLKEIRNRAKVKQVGGATYLLKFIKKRLEQKQLR